MIGRTVLAGAILLSVAVSGRAEEPSLSTERGYDVLRTKAFLPADFDEEVLSNLWTVWPEPERSEAERLSEADRRQRIFDYYGLTVAPEDPTQPLGYVRQPDGGFVMNCLACHAGQVDGKPWPGAPNSRFALQTLTEDVRLVKVAQRKPFSHLDLATLTMPLGATNGTTNAVIFGVVLGAFREPDMTVDVTRPVPAVTHHDVDAPPYWHYRLKSMIYCDGFAPRDHRPLMQFMLLPSNSRETVYGWEADFQQIQAWIESVPAPVYHGPFDRAGAERGRLVFQDHCARCHGSYRTRIDRPASATEAGVPDADLMTEVLEYPQRMVPIDDVQTDRVRFDALTVEHRGWMAKGWMSHFGERPVLTAPEGYVAPPLTGVWATAPYFHNGSVPTLWHVLHPEQRPTVWHRRDEALDHDRVGLTVEERTELPPKLGHPARRRAWFDTRRSGKSAAGHRYPDELTEPEKADLLEYLKLL